MSMFTFYFRQSGDARKPFVKAVSEILEAKPRYLGMPSMAYEIDFATVTKEGNIELNDRTDSELVENLIERLAERGYEAEPMETPYPADRDNTAAEAEPEAQVEEAAPAEVPADDDFGLTISVPRSMFSDTALENLRRLLAVKNELICKALEIDSTAIVVSDETVSFPWWEKDLNPTEVRICSRFIDRLCKFAIASKRVTAKIKASENERFDMRCWLIRLGCSGPEYKELRAAFMKNLDGDTAFRYGRPDAQRKAGQSVNTRRCRTMRNNPTITVLMVEPHRHPYLKTVEHTLENLQAMVGGYIEATYPWKADLVALVCDEDGLSKPEQEWNRYIDDYHFIRGSFFICGLGKEDFCDIPIDLAQKYAEMFWHPEWFIMDGGQLMVIREDDGSAPHV